MKRAVLVVLDGFGERTERDANAVRLAATPQLAALYAQFPSTLIETSGTAVGLPPGQMGNSEVGHMNLGAGRIVYQDLTRIDAAIVDGSFFTNPVLVDAIDACKARGGKLHLLGLTSPGGVHSSIEHAVALCELAEKRGLSQIFWHAFLDGRDTPPKSAAATIRALEARLANTHAQFATLCGRYYAMDRDQRWERVQLAYDLLTLGRAETRARIASAAIEAAYARGETDEFIKPIVLVDDHDQPRATLDDNDVVIFFNYRSDRARQMSAALTADDSFTSFPRTKRPQLARYVCMARYDTKLPLPVAFPPQSLAMGIGEYLSSLGQHQFRTAETEKYAHVTFFFNGGREAPFGGEERRLVPSPRDVATYDLKPEMSARDVAAGVVDAITSERFAFTLVNFANPDMVGHTGILPAAIDAVHVIDECLGRIADAALAHDTTVVITADHGNCEQMLDENGEPHTQHTTNPVPLVVIDPRVAGRTIAHGGRLCDIAPTVLALMDLPLPPEMTGHALITP